MRLTKEEKEQINIFLLYADEASDDYLRRDYITSGSKMLEKMNINQMQYIQQNYQDKINKLNKLVEFNNKRVEGQKYQYEKNIPKDIKLVAFPTDDYCFAFIFYSKEKDSFYIYRLSSDNSGGNLYREQEPIIEKGIVKVYVCNVYQDIESIRIIYYDDEDKIIVSKSSPSGNRQFTRENISQELELMDNKFYERMFGVYDKTKIYLENIKKFL